MAVPSPASAQGASPKVALIVMENQTYAKIVGSSSAPYMNSLIANGELLSDYHAVASGSARDYRAMTAGLTDKVTPPPNNVFHAFDQTSMTWGSFQESMGGNCGVPSSEVVPGTSQQLYSSGHDPAYLYRANETCAANDVPLTSDAQLGNLPDFSVVIPNMCDDMHTYPSTGTCPGYFGPVHGSSKRLIGDAWLQHVVPMILADPNVTVIVTFDEGTAKTGQHVYAVEVGAGVSAGTTDATRYDHYGLLAGLFQTFGLGTAPNNAATATPVPIIKETLSVTAGGPGTGSVTSDPPGIDCASPCISASASFAVGGDVTLTATPDAQSGAVVWSGCDSFTDTTCTVSMTSDRSVSVTFA